MKDYISVPENGLLVNSPLDVDEVASMINDVKEKKLSSSSLQNIKKFDHSNVDKLMQQIYLKEFWDK